MLLAPKLRLGNHERLHFWRSLQVLGWHVTSWPGLALPCGPRQGVGDLQVQSSATCCEVACGPLWRWDISPPAGSARPPEEFGSGWWQRWCLRPRSFLKVSLDWSLCSHYWEGMVAAGMWAVARCRAISRELFKIVKAFFSSFFSPPPPFFYYYYKWPRQCTKEFDPESLKNAGLGPIIFICQG